MGSATELAREVLQAEINNVVILIAVVMALCVGGLVFAFVLNQRGNNKTTEKSSESLAKVIQSSADVTLKVMAYIERNTAALDSQSGKLVKIDDSITGGFNGVQDTLTKIEKERVASQRAVIDEALDKTKQSLNTLEKSLLEQLLPLSTTLVVLRDAITGMNSTSVNQHLAIVSALQAIQRAQEHIIATAERANELPKPTFKSRAFIESDAQSENKPKPMNEGLLIQTQSED